MIRVQHPFFFGLTIGVLLAVPAVFGAEKSYPGSVGHKIKLAQEFMRQGELAKAQKQYDKAIDELNWYADHERSIRKAYDNLRTKILFSKVHGKEKVTHVVKEGESLGEVASRYGTTSEFLKKSNNLKSEVIWKGMKLRAIHGKFRLKVDKSKNEMLLLLNGRSFSKYKVSTGKKGSTPVGTFKVINKVADPTWYKEKGVVIPPGTKENHLGTRWLGFDKSGYGIHGTVDPELIGQPVSAGCVRMTNRDVEELFDLLPIGTEVTIQN